ncbi:TetR family transcriptional regulator [Sciscionella sediminilitoris]|uniref:TetR family transcriptional regulator n=1 Tax=Sciscionella sediminilitoris TaxID=1445613 RepID=UPI0004DED8AF|nr:TetR family transcriptional regulator [Sciscionella sp. SE31]
MSSFTERTRLSLREELLEAATRLLPEQGFTRLRMADVANAVGVSRQTVYNEFGNKEALVAAAALRTESGLLAEVGERARAKGTALEGLRDSLEWTIEHARANPLVAAALGAGAAADLLPFLTGAKSEPLLHSAAAVFANFFAEQTSLPMKKGRILAEQLFRLAVSHIAMPTSTPEEAARNITELVSPHLVSASDER